MSDLNGIDTKFVGFAYPKGYGNIPGLGWTVSAGVDENEILAALPLLMILSKFLR